MSSLEMENEIKQLKEIIVQLRLKLESNYMDMQRKIEKERSDYNQIIIQLQISIVELRNELEAIRTKNLKNIEEIKKEKNSEIYQLQETIKEMRIKLEMAINDSTNQ